MRPRQRALAKFRRRRRRDPRLAKAAWIGLLMERRTGLHECETDLSAAFGQVIAANTQDEYDKIALAEGAADQIALRIEQHQKGEGDFRTAMESLIPWLRAPPNYSSIRNPNKSANFLLLYFRTFGSEEKS